MLLFGKHALIRRKILNFHQISWKNRQYKFYKILKPTLKPLWLQLHRQLLKETKYSCYWKKKALLRDNIYKHAGFGFRVFCSCSFQKQPFRGVLRKSCSENMQQIYRRTPMLKCDFNKFAKQLYWNRTLAWVFSSIFAAYFQNIFS